MYRCAIYIVHVRAVAAYLKVVRRMKPSSAEGTRGERTSPPLVRGVWEPPPRNFLILSASMCAFNGVFMRFGPYFSRFGHKDVSCRVRNRMLDKIVFRQSHFFNIFFYFSMFLLTLFHLCPRRF